MLLWCNHCAMDVTVEQGSKMNKTFLTLHKLETKDRQVKKFISDKQQLKRASFRDELSTWRGPGLQQAGGGDGGHEPTASGEGWVR